MRYFRDHSLVIATHNAGKFEEMAKLLENFSGLSLYSSKDFNLTEPKETGSTYVENARLKAKFSAKMTGLPCLSDDSGIEIDGLDGAPGVYTADWAETENGRNFDYAMETVWDKLEKKKTPFPRKARFCCTLILAWPDMHEEIFQGVAEGSLTWPGRGKNGHGFDPIFVPKDYSVTYGEMDRWTKNSISHRGMAFKKMINTCFTNYDK